MGSDARPASAAGERRFHEVLDQNESLRLEIARLGGQLDALKQRVAAQDAADEHHRAELDAARSDAADARIELKEAQSRFDQARRLAAEAQERLELAERQRERAEQERAAVIAALGRRARRHLDNLESEAE